MNVGDGLVAVHAGGVALRGRSRPVAGGLDESVGIVGKQATVVGLAREGYGVALGLGAITPTVEDGENDGLGPLSHISASVSGFGAVRRAK